MNNEIKERPIIFSQSMVRAILDRRKNQTRRVVKQPIPQDIKSITPYVNRQGNEVFGWHLGANEKLGNLTELENMKCPYGKIGERLWVRETWQGPLFYGEIPEDWNSDKYKTPEYCHYKASGDSCDFTDADDCFVERWQPSIHMPRWASRILLEITNVRVERLNDISEEDAKLEGSRICDYNGRMLLDQRSNQGSYKWGYRSIWESINGPGSWDLNPWVWVLEFRRID